MYSTSTRSFTLADDAGSFNWITEGLDPADYQHMTDAEIYTWIDSHISSTIDRDEADIEERASELEYPVWGYTTDQQFQNEGEYITFKKQELRDDLAAERDEVFEFIINWIGDSNRQIVSMDSSDQREFGDLTIRVTTRAQMSDGAEVLSVQVYGWRNDDPREDEFGDMEVEVASFDLPDRFGKNESDPTVVFTLTKQQIADALALYDEIYAEEL